MLTSQFSFMEIKALMKKPNGKKKSREEVIYLMLILV